MTRKFVRWAGIALCILTLVVWIGTARHCLRVSLIGDSSATSFYASIGIFGFRHEMFPPGVTRQTSMINCGFVVASIDPWYWKWFNWGGDETGWWFVYIPFWAALVPLLGATAWAWRPTVRAWWWRRQGRCESCGYDLRGIADNCPECGRGLAPPKEAAP